MISHILEKEVLSGHHQRQTGHSSYGGVGGRSRPSGRGGTRIILEVNHSESRPGKVGHCWLSGEGISHYLLA